MADEITVTTSLSVTKSGITETLTDTGSTFDMAGTQLIKHIQSVGTGSYEALDPGEVFAASQGWHYIKNLDATNFVQIKGATGDANPVLKLKAGEHACFRFDPLAVPVAQADTSACEVIYLLLED